MKKTQILTLALLISCAPYKIYGASSSSAVDGERVVHVSSSSISGEAQIFGGIDEEFAALYPATMSGYRSFDPRIIPLVDRVERLWRDASHKDILAIRQYYFGKFFEFMDGLQTANKAPTEEFIALWKNIHAEASDALKGDLAELKWRMIEAIFMRGLLLASNGEVSEAAKDLLGEIPDMELFFGALEPTSRYLLKDGEPVQPAWKHSAVACLQNQADIDRNVIHPYLVAYPLHHSVEKNIKKTANKLGLRKNVFIPMPGLGKIGITTLTEMWLHQAYPLPLTYGEYTAHGLKLCAAAAAEHDKAHGTVDNRRREVFQAALNLLKAAPERGVTYENIGLATEIAVKRFQAFNNVLRHYLQVKKENFIKSAITGVSLSISPSVGNSVSVGIDVGGPAAKKRARQEYNVGVAALFEALHEAYAFKANVLEKATFVEAMTQLCANATTPSKMLRFNELNTLFNPQSDLLDAEIIAVVRNIPVSRTGVDVPPPAVVDAAAAAVQTIGQYPRFDLGNATIKRGDVYTAISFRDTNTGELVTLKSATAKYLFETAKDQNSLLKLIEQEVQVPVVDAALAAAEGKIAYEAAVAAWLTEVGTRTNVMINGLVADIQQPGMIGAIGAYDELVTRQNAAWAARFAPAVAVEDEGKHDV